MPDIATGVDAHCVDNEAHAIGGRRGPAEFQEGVFASYVEHLASQTLMAGDHQSVPKRRTATECAAFPFMLFHGTQNVKSIVVSDAPS